MISAEISKATAMSRSIFGQFILQNKVTLLEWAVSALLALIALFGAGLFATAAVDFCNCDSIEVDQLNSRMDPTNVEPK